MPTRENQVDPLARNTEDQFTTNLISLFREQNKARSLDAVNERLAPLRRAAQQTA